MSSTLEAPRPRDRAPPERMRALVLTSRAIRDPDRSCTVAQSGEGTVRSGRGGDLR